MTFATIFAPRKNLLRFVSEDRFAELVQKFHGTDLQEEADAIVSNLNL